MAQKAYHSLHLEDMLTVSSTSQQALMPDILHWLGITKIDRMYVSISLSIKRNVANNVLL
jgi:GTP cyclohydrolase II